MWWHKRSTSGAPPTQGPPSENGPLSAEEKPQRRSYAAHPRALALAAAGVLALLALLSWAIVADGGGGTSWSTSPGSPLPYLAYQSSGSAPAGTGTNGKTTAPTNLPPVRTSTGSGPSGAPSVSPTSSSHYMTVSADQHLVHLLLVAASTGDNGGFNFDGGSFGNITFTVPRGWHIAVTCRNAGAIDHSCAVMVPSEAGTVGAPTAFPGASTPNPILGIAPGSTSTFSFAASRAGSYQIACLVPGHERAGMWVRLVVM